MKGAGAVLTEGDRVGVCGVNQHLLCSNSFKNSGAAGVVRELTAK